MPEIAPIAPCPFCGGKPEISGMIPPNGLIRIRCIKCQAQMIEDRKDKVIAKWNNRIADRSVKLPKERIVPLGHMSDSVEWHIQGFNLCLREIKRLNPNLKFEEI